MIQSNFKWKDIPNKHLGTSSAPTSSSTTLGVGVSTPSSQQQPLQPQQLAATVPINNDSSFNIPLSHEITTSISTTSTLPSSSATSQLQARLSQPTLVQQQQSLQQQAQPQLRYLLERGTNDPPILPPPVGTTVVSTGTPGASTLGGGLVTTINSQTGTQQIQQMNNVVSSAPQLANPLLSTQGLTTTHRVWVPGTIPPQIVVYKHGSKTATVQCSHCF